MPIKKTNAKIVHKNLHTTLIQ